MSEDRSVRRRRAVPFERYPEPVVSYTVEDGEPRFQAANGAFEAVFGSPDTERSPAELLDPLRGDSLRRVADALSSDEPVAIRVETPGEGEAAYVARVLPPDGGVGYLLFTRREPLGREPASTPSPGGSSDREASLSIDSVASVLSHDLRNPLDVAEARLRAGRETGEDEHLEHVARAHDRMERIIEDVLTLSKGEEVLDPDEAVELAAVARAAWETVETDGATVTVEAGLPTTDADADRIERLFENLFRNAVEHGSTSPRSGAHEDAAEHGSTSPRSGTDEDAAEPTVTVGRLEGDREGFYVADDGPGIPPEERAAVFEPGYSTRDHGSGLGLSIVARIAEAHGWSVDVTSAESGGARIEIETGEGEPTDG